MKNCHTPISRLRDFPPGATVTLPNVAPKTLYIGGFDADGYARMWSSKESMESGLMWRVLATGSHPADLVQ